jgi:hypothetical protein
MMLYLAFHGHKHTRTAKRTASGRSGRTASGHSQRSRSNSGVDTSLTARLVGTEPRAAGDGGDDSVLLDDEEEDTALLPPNTHSQALCVKGIVFVTFWQAVLIAMLVHFQPSIFKSSDRETWTCVPFNSIPF